MSHLFAGPMTSLAGTLSLWRVPRKGPGGSLQCPLPHQPLSHPVSPCLPPSFRGWGERGRTALVATDRLSDFMNRETVADGQLLTRKALSVALKKERELQLQARGFSAMGAKTPTKQTVGRYFALSKAMPGVKVVMNPLSKNENRFVSETSIMSAVAFAVTAAEASFIAGVRDKRFQPLAAGGPSGKGANATKALVKQALNGAEVFSVHPSLIISTDDTTQYVFTGISEQAGGAVGPASGSGSVHGYFVQNGRGNKQGLRVRHTVSMSAGGFVAPIFVSVTGLTEEDLPPAMCPDGILIVAVPGLSIGAAVDPRNQHLGYVAFLRSRADGATTGSDSPELACYRYYRKEVFLPWVEKLRETICPGACTGEEVPDALTANSWMDGGIPQLSATVAEDLQALDEKLKVNTCKHSAAASATEQPADLSACFRVLSQLEKTSVVEAETAASAKRTLLKRFEAVKKANQLTLKHAVLNCLVDYLARLPGIMQRACTSSNVVKGFVEAGLLDRDTKTHPDVHAMLATCRRKITSEEEKLFTDNFSILFKEQQRTGHLPDEFLAKIGFRPDVAPDGKVVHRSAENAESRQRAKNLGSQHQRTLRLQQHQEALDKIRESDARKRAAFEKVLRLSEECERTVKQPPGNIEPLSVEAFAKVKTKDLLAGFLHARTYPTAALMSKTANFKRGTLQMAQSDQDCLVLRAFQVREAPVMMSFTEVELPVATRPLEALVVAADAPLSTDRESARKTLEDDAWVRGVTAELLGLPQELSPDASRGSQLYCHLAERLRTHIVLKVPAAKHTHPVWEWCSINAPRAAAVIELQGHARQDMATATRKSCLLGDPAAFTSATDFSDCSGVYLFYDQAERVFVRSGKTDRTFSDRLQEHKQGALLKRVGDTSSIFYWYVL